MLRILYMLYLWLFVVPVFVVLTILTALTVIVGCLLGGERIFAYYPGMIWSWLTCHLALCPVKVKGRENIDRKKSYVFVANHQGAFDIFLIYGFLGVPIKWVMKAGIAKIPFVGAACRAAGFIFVDNSTPKAVARSVLEAERSLKNGASVVVFPEGSRTYNGKMIRFKKGAYQMAADQHLQIVPITLNGPFDVLPIGSLNIHRHKMEMVIHPPIPTEGMDASHKGLQQMADKTQDIIASALWEQYK
ncbi:lysophospholipid acyltransferase family protein [Parabacteroides merdae]|jgi:1-acyl-sn-glycerol-3-phosphate acyltransferase|uniref:lysophospholipid acyltransferase family protein n=1 Tax=Parabacteroides merdae TaxID=46503 RepID=UPI00232D59AC|nr:lysophospholipid acyltransferase family protein [Parabacteroides merdae]MDB8885323.1 lysophospholipid acyltransferase family protein [Parabacteroides merdae]MDB8888839.1 lysophospholipid acyltransferase family protein [Parabacteroides merdae]